MPLGLQVKKNIEFDLTMTFDPDWMVNPEESAECAGEGLHGEKPTRIAHTFMVFYGL